MIDLQAIFTNVAGESLNLNSRESDSDSEINEARNLSLEMPDPDNPLDKFLKHIEAIAELDPQAARNIAMAEMEDGRFRHFNSSKLEAAISELNMQLGFAPAAPGTDPTWEQEAKTPSIRPSISPAPGGFV